MGTGRFVCCPNGDLRNRCCFESFGSRNLIQPLVCQVSGYHIHDVSLVASLGIFIGLLPLVGFAVTRIKSVSAARLIAWGMTISSTGLVERLSTAEPSGTRMVLVIVALLFSMKLVVAIESRSRGDKPLPFWNWIAFTMFWFGMRTRLFAEFGNPLKDDWQTYIVRGFWRIGLGAALFGAAYLLSFNSTPSITSLTTWSMTLCLMRGLSVFSCIMTDFEVTPKEGLDFVGNLCPGILRQGDWVLPF